MTVCTSMCVWGSQRTTCWSLSLSFHHVGPTDWTQVISLDDKQFYPLHSTVSTILLFFCKVARKLQSRVTVTSGYLRRHCSESVSQLTCTSDFSYTMSSRCHLPASVQPCTPHQVLRIHEPLFQTFYEVLFLRSSPNLYSRQFTERTIS